MTFTSASFEIHVRDLAAARHFYVDQLGLPVLQETAALKLLAVRTGASRLTIFGDQTGDQTGVIGKQLSHITLATENIDATIAELRSRGVIVAGEPIEAKGFMRFVILSDPEGHTVGIAQHLRDPIAPI